MWFNALLGWIIQSAIFGAIVLALGAAALLRVRQPVHRIRVIQGTLLACVSVLALQQSNLMPAYFVARWAVPAAPSTEAVSAVPTHASESAVAGAAGQRLELPGRDPAAHQDAKFIPQQMPWRAAMRNADPPAVALPDSTHANKPSLPHWLGGTLVLAYLAGVAALVAAWLLGLFIRGRIVYHAQPASYRIQAVLHEVAGDKANCMRLLVSDRIGSPITWGLLRPTIVVPEQLAEHAHASGLKYGLAHECAHIARRDVATLALANFTKLVCFYQPVYWWLRKQLSLSQDYLADAFAARQGEGAEDYAAFLVSLAKRRKMLGLAGVLCMADRKSNLFRRVCMLVKPRVPLRQRAGRGPTLAVTAVATLLVLFLGTIHLSAQPPAETGEPKDPQPASNDASANRLPAPITYGGKVIDRETGEPIAGALVEVTRELSHDPRTGRWITLETTRHETDQAGNYRFTLPPEQVAESSLYLVVDAFHPDYQPKGRSGYSHTMILKNLELGEPPFYETIELSRGEPIAFKVLRPDGQPATDLHVVAYTKARSAEPRMSFERGAFQDAKTNDQGEARIVVPTPGDGVIWIYPKDFAPVAIRIGDRRGNIEDVELETGTRVSGKVLDAQGEPVSHVAVNLRRSGDGEAADEFLNQNAVANGIRAGAVTDDEGHFQLNPLPPGTYRAEIGSRLDDPTRPPEPPGEEEPLDDVFLPLEITIGQDADVEPIEIRAVPHVVVRGRFFDSQGQPRASHQQILSTRMHGQGVFARSTRPGNDGWFEFKVPQGAQDAVLLLSTNEHSSLRWRTAPEEPLRYGQRIELGTLEEDLATVEIVRYTAPILLLRAVDEDGNQLRDFVPNSRYATRSEEDAGVFLSGPQGAIGFEKQPDGRWRSSQMLPDEEVTVSLNMDGYAGEPQTVALREGETRELVFVMKRSSSKP